jgi:5'-3' exonuclease
MCILSGCDYLDNISGIGLAKAKKIMSRTQVANIELVEFIRIFSQKKIFSYVNRFLNNYHKILAN